MKETGTRRLIELAGETSAKRQTFSTFDLPSESRRAALQDFTCGAYKIHDLRSTLADHKYLVSNTTIPLRDGWFNRVKRGPNHYCTLDRDNSFYRDFLWLVKVRSGSIYVDVESQQSVQENGYLYLRSAQTGYINENPVNFDALAIPRDRLSADFPYPCLLKVPLTSPPALLLNAAFDTFCDLSSDISIDKAKDMEAALRTLVAAVFAPVSSIRQRRSTMDRDARLRDYINENLERGDLDAETLMQVFGMSRSSLFRAMSTDSGVNRYVSVRRLIRARDELAAAKNGSVKISTVAARWGWDDLGHFSRSFRSMFGVSPSQILGAHARPSPDFKNLRHR
ncbi:MAG: AraC family transcriptional regulator [Pseudomonadota bacterium]